MRKSLSSRRMNGGSRGVRLFSMNSRMWTIGTIYGKDFSNGPANSSGTAGNNCMLAVEAKTFRFVSWTVTGIRLFSRDEFALRKNFPLSCALLRWPHGERMIRDSQF